MQEAVHSARSRRLLIATVALAAFFHTWQLEDIPRGLYVDEASIGYNAHLIATRGTDEHGQPWPLYFRAFGEYKNPLYIYTTALIFKILGTSILALRLTSTLFFLLLLAAVYRLVNTLFKNNTITLYALAAMGFLPWFFPLSRIAFEVISQPALIATALCLIFNAYERSQPEKNTDKYAFLAGVMIGISVYTYSTARLLSPLLLLTGAALYTRRRTLKKSLLTLTGFGITFVPYLHYATTNSQALTGRFKLISYLYDPTLSTTQKIITFIDYYRAHFGPEFLLLQGDHNLRHAIGYGGEIFFTVFFLTIAGLLYSVLKANWSKQKFILLLLLNSAAAPLASATTTTGTPMPFAQRSILLGLYITLLSCYGLYALLQHTSKTSHTFLLATVFSLLVIETIFYLHNYFADYPPKSIAWFESHDFRGMLAYTLQQRPKEIVISTQGHQPYILHEFYQLVVPNPNNIPIRLAQPTAAPGTCILYFSAWSGPPTNPENLLVAEYSPSDSLVKLRCYQNL